MEGSNPVVPLVLFPFFIFLSRHSLTPNPTTPLYSIYGACR